MQILRHQFQKWKTSSSWMSSVSCLHHLCHLNHYRRLLARLMKPPPRSRLARILQCLKKKKKENISEDILQELRMGNEIAKSANDAFIVSEQRSAILEERLAIIEERRNEIFIEFTNQSRMFQEKLQKLLEEKK